MLTRPVLPQGFLFVVSCAALLAVSACTERSLAGPETANADPDKTADFVTPLKCTATVASGKVACNSELNIAGGSTNRLAAPTEPGKITEEVIGFQNGYVRLTSSNVSYDSGTEIFQFDVSVQNLLNEAIGSLNSGVADPQGIRVFFFQDLRVTSGFGAVSVANADGTDTFLGTNEPFYRYSQILAKDQVSALKTWQFSIASTVDRFDFSVYLSTNVERLIVINELLVNPGGTISDSNGEWVELYNAGTLAVNLQNLVIADSVAMGRRPFRVISSSVPMAPGAYVVLGETTNTTNNGGVPVDYAYGSTYMFPNSLGAFKISRVFGTDTITIDRTQYASAAISAQNGISRELKNPALDNSNMDGSNWADALPTAVYGPGGRGTPKAQNSTFTP